MKTENQFVDINKVTIPLRCTRCHETFSSTIVLEHQPASVYPLGIICTGCLCLSVSMRPGDKWHEATELDLNILRSENPSQYAVLQAARSAWGKKRNA